jgi:hypothetical protein
MKFGVVTFPGSNCDEDMIHVLETTIGPAGGEALAQGPRPERGGHGGAARWFLLRRLPAQRSHRTVLAHHAGSGGTCQERAAWSSGYATGSRCSAKPVSCLVHCSTTKARSSWRKNTFIRPATRNTVLTKGVPDKALKIPIAHGEGRYHADAATLKALKDRRSSALPVLRCRWQDPRCRQPQRQQGEHRRGLQQGPQRVRHDAPSRARMR